MIKYGPFLYTIFYLFSKFLNDNTVYGVLFALSVLYLCLNLVYEWDDYIILTPLFVFVCSYVSDTFDLILIITIPIIEFLWLWWYNILRKNSECSDNYLEYCRKTLILSSCLLLISFCKALEFIDYDNLFLTLSVIIAWCIFLYVHMDSCLKKSAASYSLTKNDDQEDLFGINDDMI